MAITFIVTLVISIVCCYLLYHCCYSPAERVTSDLEYVVEWIVESFKDHRRENSEFAVLFPLPTEDTLEWLELVKKCCIKPLNRDENPFYDDNKHFIAARPANGKHAEVIILDKLSEWKSEDENIFWGSRAILIYSWIIPCPECQEAIRCSLLPYCKTHKIMVLYTTPKKAKLPFIEGIEINRVKYPLILPPPEKEQDI